MEGIKEQFELAKVIENTDAIENIRSGSHNMFEILSKNLINL